MSFLKLLLFSLSLSFSFLLVTYPLPLFFTLNLAGIYVRLRERTYQLTYLPFRVIRALQAAPAATASVDCHLFLESQSQSQSIDHSTASNDEVMIPDYASPCRNVNRYRSACSCLGVPASTKTVGVDAEREWGTTTTTETVPYVATPTRVKVKARSDTRVDIEEGEEGEFMMKMRRAADRRIVKLDEALDLDVVCVKKVRDALDAAASDDSNRKSTVVPANDAVRDGVTVMSVVRTTITATVTKAAGTSTVTESCSTSQKAVVNAVAQAIAPLAASPASCLKDSSASAIVAAVRGLLVSEDKKEVEKAARGLLAEEFLSVNAEDVS